MANYSFIKPERDLGSAASSQSKVNRRHVTHYPDLILGDSHERQKIINEFDKIRRNYTTIENSLGKVNFKQYAQKFPKYAKSKE